jgi:hypothetical protein
MHSKAIKICNLAQRVHGSKVEARIDGKLNSAELDKLKRSS